MVYTGLVCNFHKQINLSKFEKFISLDVQLRPNYLFSKRIFIIIILLQPFFAHLFLFEFSADHPDIWPQWNEMNGVLDHLCAHVG